MPVQTMGRPIQNAQGMVPQPSFMDRLAEMSPALLQTSAGLLSGRTGAEQFALGAQGFGQGVQGIKDKREADLKKNKTFAWLEKNATPEELEAVRAGITTANDLFKAKTSQKAEKPSYGKNPIWGTNAEGQTVLGVVGDNATFVPLDTGGFNPAPGFDEIDTGTEIIRMDKRSGAVISRTPKQNYQEAFDSGRGSELGKASAQAEAEAPKSITNALTTASQLDELIFHPGLDQIYGSMDQYRPSALMGTQGKDALARYKQLQGKAFLEAYGMLKGGGQITEVEGIKAEAAMARLDRAQDVETAREALTEFRDAVRAGAQKLQAQYGNSQPVNNSGWVDKGNGVRIRQVK